MKKLNPKIGITISMINKQVKRFLLALMFIGFNSFRSKINTCSNCGAISLGLSETCMNCGADLENLSKNNKLVKKPSESTIEVIAEEVK